MIAGSIDKNSKEIKIDEARQLFFYRLAYIEDIDWDGSMIIVVDGVHYTLEGIDWKELYQSNKVL